MIERIYTAEFANGYIVTMTASLSGVDITWSPKMPTITVKFISTYREWRNTCLADFAKASGGLSAVVE